MSQELIVVLSGVGVSALGAGLRYAKRRFDRMTEALEGKGEEQSLREILLELRTNVAEHRAETAETLADHGQRIVTLESRVDRIESGKELH